MEILRSTEQLRERLLALAAVLEAERPNDTQGVHIVPDVGIHGITDRETLASWVRLMTDPQAKQTCNGTCWIAGEIGGIKFACFYSAGLLGPLRTETVREVEVEESQDLAGLLAEFEGAGVEPQEAGAA